MASESSMLDGTIASVDGARSLGLDVGMREVLVEPLA